MNPLVNVDVHRVIRVGEVAGVEDRAHALDILGSQGVGENRPEVLDAERRGLEPMGVVEGDGERPGVDDPPAVSELVGIHAVEVEATVATLERRHAVVVAFEEQLDRLAAELRAEEPVELDRPAASLGVADLPDEDGGVGALVAALAGEVGVADLLGQEPFDRLGGPGVLDVAGRVVGCHLRAEDVSVGADDPLRDADDRVLLDVEDRDDSLHEGTGIDRRLGHEDDVGLAVGRRQRDHPAVAAHDLDDRDPAMALGRRPYALDARRRDVDGRRVAGRHVVHHLVEAELAVGPLLVEISARPVGRFADVLVRLVGVVQAEVVVDRLGGQDRGQVVAQGLHAVERPVAADADQAVDVQSLEPAGDPGDGLEVVAADVVARGAQDRAAQGRAELGDLLEQRVEVDVGHRMVQEAAEPLDDPEDLDPVFVGSFDRAFDGRIEGGRVAPRREDADPLHRGCLRPGWIDRGQSRRGEGGGGRGSFEGQAGTAFELHDVSQRHLLALAGLDLAVDADHPVGDQGLGLAAVGHPAGELQDLRQVDRAITDVQPLHHSSYSIGWPRRPAGGRGGPSRRWRRPAWPRR